MKHSYFLLVCFLAGCATGTVTPPLIVAKAGSVDPAGTQNSGIIEVIPNQGRVVTPHWRDRFNALVKIYGADKMFLPALKPDQGITPDGANYFVQATEAEDFDLMNTWNKSKTHQPKTLLQKATGL